MFGAVGLDNQPPEETVAIIISMGFQRNLAIQALKATVSSLYYWYHLGFVSCYLLCTCTCSDTLETCIEIQLGDAGRIFWQSMIVWLGVGRWFVFHINV